MLWHPGVKMIEINGVAHLALKVSNWEECRLFYEQLLEFLGMTRVFSGQDGVYYIGGKTALGVGPCDDEYKDRRFVQGTVGLHHVCFRAKSRGDVDEIHRFCEAKTVTIVHPPEEGPWAPGYYSLLIEDPAGIRIEFNHVPGKGLLDGVSKFNPVGYR